MNVDKGNHILHFHDGDCKVECSIPPFIRPKGRVPASDEGSWKHHYHSHACGSQLSRGHGRTGCSKTQGQWVWVPTNQGIDPALAAWFRDGSSLCTASVPIEDALEIIPREITGLAFKFGQR
jgi:hypothetical protein